MLRTPIRLLTSAAVVAAAALALVVPEARAQRREATLDHAGSVGFIAALGEGYSTSEVASCPACASTRVIVGFGTLLDVGGTIAVGERSSEIALRLRLERLAPAPGEALLLGYRQYFGREEWKTFFSLDGVGTFRPIRTIGARAALGLMRELSPVLGVYGDFGAAFGIGGGRRFGVEFAVGLQARSYLLE